MGGVEKMERTVFRWAVSATVTTRLPVFLIANTPTSVLEKKRVKGSGNDVREAPGFRTSRDGIGRRNGAFNW